MRKKEIRLHAGHLKWVTLSFDLPMTSLERDAMLLLKDIKLARFIHSHDDAARLAAYDELVKRVGPLLGRSYEETGVSLA